ncbi:MAG: hypothetical protein ABFQ62_03140 [Patescibacteria group bacterium]
MFKIVISSFLAVLSVFIFSLSVFKSKRKQFYSDTNYLIPIGIFVWGDALILAPFWMISSIIFMFWPILWIFRYVLLFWIFRSAYEVVFWINHQVIQKNYKPPLFRKIKWLGAEEAGILYQLLNMCQLILFLTILLISFSF